MESKNQFQHQPQGKCIHENGDIEYIRINNGKNTKMSGVISREFKWSNKVQWAVRITEQYRRIILLNWTEQLGVKTAKFVYVIHMIILAFFYSIACISMCSKSVLKLHTIHVWTHVWWGEDHLYLYSIFFTCVSFLVQMQCRHAYNFLCNINYWCLFLCRNIMW